MGPRGMYLNKWDLFFYYEKYILKVVPVWVKLPHLLLHSWNDEDFRAIGNTLGKYIDKSEHKAPMLSYARICVEFDLEKGLPEAINLSIEGWNHQRQLTMSKSPLNANTVMIMGIFPSPAQKNQIKLTQKTIMKKTRTWQAGKRVLNRLRYCNLISRQRM